MIGRILLEIFLALLPVTIYFFVMRRLQRERGIGTGPQGRMLMILFGVGLLIAAGVLVWLGLSTSRDAGRYEPATVIDGELQPLRRIDPVE